MRGSLKACMSSTSSKYCSVLLQGLSSAESEHVHSERLIAGEGSSGTLYCLKRTV